MLVNRRTGALAAAAALVLGLVSAPLAGASAASPSPSPSPSASGTTPAADPGANNITFGVGPATKGKVDRRSGFNYLQPRGGSVSDEVALVNLTFKPLTLNLYPADAINGADGTLGIEPRTTKPVGAAAWVTMKTPTGKFYVVVPSRSTVVVPFTVRIPAKAEVGDHLAGIVASVVSQGQTPGDRTANVKFEQRIAARLAVRVAGPLLPELTIENLTAQYVGTLNPAGKGSVLVTYTVRNTGNIRLGGRQEVGIHGIIGPRATASDIGDIPLLLPGGSAQVAVEVPGILPLLYMSADVNVTALPPLGDADPVSDIATASTQFWAVPWTVLALLLLLGLLLAWFLRHRRQIPQAEGGRRERGGGDSSTGRPLVTAGSSASPQERQS